MDYCNQTLIHNRQDQVESAQSNPCAGFWMPEVRNYNVLQWQAGMTSAMEDVVEGAGEEQMITAARLNTTAAESASGA